VTQVWYVPRMADPRVHVSFRVSQKGFDWAHDLAEEERVDRSLVLRLALVVAKQHEKELRDLIRSQT
jgi:hypothetical protein